MDTFSYILLSTFLISLLSFAGAVILFLREEILDKILLLLVSFAAGALMGSAFFHLLPEAIETIGLEEGILKVSWFFLFGFCAFFVLENSIHWHHHHARNHPEIKPFSYLILISDGFHNFIDGLIVAAAFVVSFPLGLVTVLAVASHEIPQEIGDFGILTYSGFKKVKALWLNFFSASTIILGGIVGFFLSERMGGSLNFLLPFAAGSFVYIACSDLIPEIKHHDDKLKPFVHFFIFLFGLGAMFLLTLMEH
jgi:zinc and cadmium transporter